MAPTMSRSMLTKKNEPTQWEETQGLKLSHLKPWDKEDIEASTEEAEEERLSCSRENRGVCVPEEEWRREAKEEDDQSQMLMIRQMRCALKADLGFPGQSPETHSPDSVGQLPSRLSKVIWVKRPSAHGNLGFSWLLVPLGERSHLSHCRCFHPQ